MSTINGFDRIARFYDPVQRMVFGNAIMKSQVAFLRSIEKDSKVLMIGGGTGEVLEALITLNKGCHVWYVEASSAMIARAKERIGTRSSHVTFIHGSDDSIPAGVAFDAAITGFFLDLFPEEKVGALSRRIGGHLRRNGLWLITDFVDQRKWWQELLLWSMYRFFVVTCGIEARTLPAWEHQVANNGFRERESRLFFGDFIKSAVLIKSSDENYI